MSKPFRYALTNSQDKNDKTEFVIISKAAMSDLQLQEILNAFLSGKTYLPSRLGKTIVIHDDLSS